MKYTKLDRINNKHQTRQTADRTTGDDMLSTWCPVNQTVRLQRFSNIWHKEILAYPSVFIIKYAVRSLNYTLFRQDRKIVDRTNSRQDKSQKGLKITQDLNQTGQFLDRTISRQNLHQTGQSVDRKNIGFTYMLSYCHTQDKWRENNF